jgi:hypothetical protein
MSPIGRTGFCKIPPPPPPFGYALTQGVNRCIATRYGSFDFKVWRWGTPFSLALTMKVNTDLPPKLISWVVDHTLLLHLVWSWSNQNYLKNKGGGGVFIVMVWSNPDLGHLVWWLLKPWYSYMQTMMILRRKTKSSISVKNSVFSLLRQQMTS